MMDAVNFAAWEGRTALEEGSVSASLARQIHVSLDRPGLAPALGDPLPALWHWCAFPPDAPNAELGADGHPHLGDFLPPIHLSRRMWAGGALDFMAPLRVGERLERRTMILKVENKGREAPMMFITLEHEIRGARGLAVRERQTLVYLDIPETFVPPKKRPMPEAPRAERQLPVTAPTLFRFSAVTFNAHRIHYDLDYTQRVENYPALVIHGPYQAMQLMALAEETAGRMPSWFEFRGVHPMFLGQDLTLAACDDGEGGLELFSGQDGHQGTVARAGWEGTV